MVVYTIYVFYFIVIFYSFIFGSLSEHNFKKKHVHSKGSKHLSHKHNMEKHKHSKPTHFEIRAVLMRCLHYDCQLHPGISENPILKKTAQFVRANDHSHTEETAKNQKIKKCNKKILVTAHMRNKGILDSKNQYVVIDHVYDPSTDSKYRLFNPYILKLKQHAVMQYYNMIFDHVVNSKAKEVVHNKNQQGYKGCNTGEKNPTCQPIIHNGQEIPYSSGFCCSCKSKMKDFSNSVTDSNSMLLSDVAKLALPESMQSPESWDHMEDIQTTDSWIHKDDSQIMEPWNHADDSGLNIGELVSESSREALMGPLNLTFDGSYQQRDFRRIGFEPPAQETPVDLANFTLNDKYDYNFLNESTKYIPKAPMMTPQWNDQHHLHQPELTSESSQARSTVSSSQQQNKVQTRSYKEKYNTKSINVKLEKPALVHNRSRVARSTLHPRGGQDCQDNYTPPNANPATYHDSAHCLKFSDVWYSVYRLEKPSLRHSVQMQIFEKIEDHCGNIRWHDLTQGNNVKVGTENLHFQNSGPSLAATYTVKTNLHFSPSLDPSNDRILIPDTIKSNNIMKYPEVTGGPPEYLVVPKKMISPDGKECNKAGVGFEAFNKQTDRCTKHQGSCLKNQPSDFWQHDHKAEMEGKTGKYFLKFHGTLPKKPIKEKCQDHSQILSLYYQCVYSNLLELEFRADHNTLLKPHSSAIITEIYIDVTRAKMLDIKVKVLNSGLVAGIFYISMTECPLEMPADFNNIGSKPVLIAPQLQHAFDLNIRCGLPQIPFHCTIHVLNTRQEIIAARKIRIEQLDRCICVWYCKCSCLIADDGLKCNPMTLDSFNAAGFQGSLPVAIQLVEYTFVDDVLSILLYLFLFLCSTLLIMGLTKALIGWCCCIPVGHWGFDVLLNLPKKMNAYHELDLIGRPVEYSPSGWPIHPDTKEKVRNIPTATEFCLNLIFFFIYPLMLLTIMFRKMCGMSFSKDECETCLYDLEEGYCTCEEEKPDEEVCPCCKCN